MIERKTTHIYPKRVRGDPRCHCKETQSLKHHGIQHNAFFHLLRNFWDLEVKDLFRSFVNVHYHMTALHGMLDTAWTQPWVCCGIDQYCRFRRPNATHVVVSQLSQVAKVMHSSSREANEWDASGRCQASDLSARITAKMRGTHCSTGHQRTQGEEHCGSWVMRRQQSYQDYKLWGRVVQAQRAQRLKGNAMDYEPKLWSGEKDSESFTAFNMELQNWVGAHHDHLLKVVEIAESREGQIDRAGGEERGAASRGSGRVQRYGVGKCSVPAHHGEANNNVCNPESSLHAWQLIGQPFRPQDWCGQVGCTVASDTSTVPEWVDHQKTQDATECQKHPANAGTRSTRV